MTLGAWPVDFPEMPPEMPPQSSGCPGTALDVAGRQNPTFRGIFPGFVAISGRHRTLPEVYGIGRLATELALKGAGASQTGVT